MLDGFIGNSSLNAEIDQRIRKIRQVHQSIDQKIENNIGGIEKYGI